MKDVPSVEECGQETHDQDCQPMMTRPWAGRSSRPHISCGVALQISCRVMAAVYGLCNSLDDNGHTLLLQLVSEHAKLTGAYRLDGFGVWKKTIKSPAEPKPVGMRVTAPCPNTVLGLLPAPHF